MVYSSLGKKTISSVLAMAFVISGCMPTDVASTRESFQAGVPTGATTSGAAAGATTDTSTAATSVPPKVEIRHLIEPNLSTDPNYTSGTGYAGGGSYVRKLTLPKNFQGRLYLAGINIGTLADRHVKVRFKFGVGREAVTIPAVVTKAPGITPQTNINVLVMDMRSEPFRNVRLTYDLFDYNEYGPTQTPVQDNRDTGLYCRGLRVEDDPTFNGVGACDGLQQDEECLYSYAKVMDQGLVKEVVNPDLSVTYVPVAPTLSQVRSTLGSVYYNDSSAQHLKKPLADNLLGPFKFSGTTDTPALGDVTFELTSSPLTLDWTAKYINDSNYFYRGPYRLVNTAEWQFKFADPVGPKGLFRASRSYSGPAQAVPEYDGSYTPGTKLNGVACSSHTQCNSLHCNKLTNQCSNRKSIGSTCSSHTECSSLHCERGTNLCAQPKVYYESNLFPLATQLDLSANAPHLSSVDWNDVRNPTSVSIPGKTLWMDGSNARSQSKNSELEHIGSCNVAATIEIIAKDNNGVEYVVALSKDVKLQLVRPIQHFTDTGNDVLYSNFKTCSSNASCGGSECCFNNRCWDQSLVSQCYDSSSTQGNKQVGDSCLTDMECSSLCCNRASGLCSPHDTGLNPAVLCSKPIGDFCIAKEWCQKTPIVKCLVVKTGTDALGNVTCRQQCYTTNEYGECKQGMCIAPYQETIPVFDPDAEGACDGAVPAPNF